MARPNRRPRGWKSWFGSFFTAPRAAGPPRRLRLESLESRWVRSSFTVTDNSDSAADVNSLRYAIDNLASGTAASANTITIDSVLTGGQTITLGGLLDINEGVTITGPGASSVAISGGNTVGVFKVESGINASISGLTITKGVADAGGGVDNLGTVSIDNCTLSGDSATLDFGGALYNSRGVASITNSTISGNSSTLGGGGIHNAYGSLSIANCTISGNTSARCGGAIYDLEGTLSVANSTLTGNVTDNSTYGGGALYNRYGSVSIDNCTLSGNSATKQGGGIENYDGTLSVDNSTISGNSSTTDGGGLQNSGSTTIANSTISGNSANTGGGIFNSDYGTLSIDNSTISGDSASSWGGGIYNIDSTLSVANSTLTGNSAMSAGGALYNRYGSVSIANSTISGNSTSHRGGGLYNGYGTLSIANSTISGNSAGRNGGGIYNEATATLKNSIVSGNRAPANPDVSDVTGGLTDQGDNLLGTALDTGSPPASDVFSDTPGLAALGNYGGGTETMALLPGSPALGAGSALGGGIAATDQRGVNRPATGPIDIGAYQSQGFTLTLAGGASPQTALVGSGFAHALALTVTANGLGGAVDGGVIAFTSTPGLNGQSATLSGPRATISGGEASVTATANNQAGAYTVSASPGNTSSPVSFDLTNQIQSSVVLPVAVQPSLYSNNTSDAGTSYVDSLYRAILGRLPGVTHKGRRDHLANARHRSSNAASVPPFSSGWRIARFTMTPVKTRRAVNDLRIRPLSVIRERAFFRGAKDDNLGRDRRRQ